MRDPRTRILTSGPFFSYLYDSPASGETTQRMLIVDRSGTSCKVAAYPFRCTSSAIAGLQTRKIAAVYKFNPTNCAGQIQLVDVNAKQKLREQILKVEIEFFTWLPARAFGKEVDDKGIPKLAIVTSSAVFHMSSEGSEPPQKLWGRYLHENQNYRAVDYQISPDLSWSGLLCKSSNSISLLELYHDTSRSNSAFSVDADAFVLINYTGCVWLVVLHVLSIKFFNLSGDTFHHQQTPKSKLPMPNSNMDINLTLPALNQPFTSFLIPLKLYEESLDPDTLIAFTGDHHLCVISMKLSEKNVHILKELPFTGRLIEVAAVREKSSDVIIMIHRDDQVHLDVLSLLPSSN